MFRFKSLDLIGVSNIVSYFVSYPSFNNILIIQIKIQFEKFQKIDPSNAEYREYADNAYACVELLLAAGESRGPMIFFDLSMVS